MAPNAQTAVRVKGQIYAFGVWLLTGWRLPDGRAVTTRRDRVCAFSAISPTLSDVFATTASTICPPTLLPAYSIAGPPSSSTSSVSLMPPFSSRSNR